MIQAVKLQGLAAVMRNQVKSNYKKTLANHLSPLHPCSTSIPMTCPRDMIFSVLYGGDRDLTRFYVHQSMDRLGAEWEKREFEPDLARVLFFLLL